MPGDDDVNGAAPPVETPAPKSIREVAEAAWTEVVENPSEDGSQPAAGQDGRDRDSLGRFVAKTPGAEPGEQSGTQPDPAPQQVDKTASPTPPTAQPAPPGSSTEAPQHWSEQHRQMFAKQTPEAQAFLLERHRDMEADYTRKTQHASTALEFTNALAPVFQDPAIAASLQAAGLSPFQAIGQWAAIQKRFVDPNIEVRRAVWMEMGQRMGLQPAGAGTSQPGPGQLSEADLKDPAIKYFADHVGSTSSKLAALETQLSEMRNAEAVKTARWQIDAFAEEKDAAGRKLHPHFDNPQVQQIMMSMIANNPHLDIRKAYSDAIYLDPELRQLLISEQIDAKVQADKKAAELARAKQAVRSNVRGMTSPVSKPPPGDGKPMGLRAAIEAAADEVGLN